MTCPWAQDAPNLLRWEMGPRAPGDAAESRAGIEPRQRAGGSVLQQVGLCHMGGPGGGHHSRGPCHSGGHTQGVSEQGALPQWRGGPHSRSVSPGLLHVTDVGLPHHLLVVRGCLPQPQVGTSQGKSGGERSVSPESGCPGLRRLDTDWQTEKEQII